MKFAFLYGSIPLPANSNQSMLLHGIKPVFSYNFVNRLQTSKELS
jgi:hypothetical protein